MTPVRIMFVLLILVGGVVFIAACALGGAYAIVSYEAWQVRRLHRELTRIGHRVRATFREMRHEWISDGDGGQLERWTVVWHWNDPHARRLHAFETGFAAEPSPYQRAQLAQVDVLFDPGDPRRYLVVEPRVDRLMRRLQRACQARMRRLLR